MALPGRAAWTGALDVGATCPFDPPISTQRHAQARWPGDIRCDGGCGAHSLAHVRDENTLGTAALRLNGRDRLPLGGDRVEALASCVPTATRACLVHDRAMVGVPACSIFHLVVQV